MLQKRTLKMPENHRYLLWALVLALLFANIHVALHKVDLAAGDADQHESCQVCRLNHVPATLLPQPALFWPASYYCS